MRRVVVGVGPRSSAALALAVDEALRRRLPLHVVRAVPAYACTGMSRPSLISAAVEEHVREIMSGIVGADLVPVRVHVREGQPGEALRSLAEGAALVVVGRGVHTEELLRRTWAPVMIVPAGSRRLADRTQCRVLVGVDGSPASQSALVWATAQARQWGSELHPLTAAGRVVEELVRAPRPDDLLVVGSRGQGGAPSLVLGSTSACVARLCPATVVVVHPGQARRETTRQVVRPGTGRRARQERAVRAVGS